MAKLDYSKYTKAILAGVYGVLNIVSLYIILAADGSITPQDQVALIAAIITALGGTGAVYQFPNKKS